MIERSAPDWTAFAVDLDYTDAELENFQRIIRARAGRAANPGWFWLTLCLSIAIGLVLVWAATGLGLADHDAAGLLGLTIVGAFWLGVYLPALLLQRSRRRPEFRQFREDWRGASLLLSPRGAVLRRPHIRLAYGRETIARATSEHGLILLWVSPRRPLAVPERLLTAEQRAWMLAMPRAVGSATLGGAGNLPES